MKEKKKTRRGNARRKQSTPARAGNAAKNGAGRVHWKPGNMLYPAPPVMVTCASGDGHPNIITIGWTGNICTNPPMVYISVRPGRYSYDLIKDTGEFVINLTTAELARAADFCGVRSGRDIDKFAACGLTPVPSEKVAPPSIAESPVSIECRVTQIIPLGSHDMFLAEVLGVSADSGYIGRSGRLALERAGLAAYSHGGYYELGRFIGKFGFSVRRRKGAGQKERKK